MSTHKKNSYRAHINTSSQMENSACRKSSGHDPYCLHCYNNITNSHKTSVSNKYKHEFSSGVCRDNLIWTQHIFTELVPLSVISCELARKICWPWLGSWALLEVGSLLNHLRRALAGMTGQLGLASCVSSRNKLAQARPSHDDDRGQKTASRKTRMPSKNLLATYLRTYFWLKQNTWPSPVPELENTTGHG